MAQPYVGTIRMFAGNFAPVGWAFCEGQSLPIAENEVLFQLIGTTYGGDGESAFNLPNLAGRVLVHQGTGAGGTSYGLGDTGGTEQVTLTTQQIPIHTHALLASESAGTASSPAGNLLAISGGGIQMYYEGDVDSSMHVQSLTPVGGSQPHENMQPFVGINFIISLFGLFPNQS